MPLVQISLVEGRSVAERCALISSVTDAVTDTLGVAADHVRVLISELPAANWGVAGRTKEDA
jgi:4-oxalocrotonate tautomerase